MKRISNKCKAYGCDFHYEQTGEEFRELKDEKGNKYTARFVLVEAEGTAIINDWKFIAELEHTENGNIITGVAGVEVPERYYTTKPMCEHCNSTVKVDTQTIAKAADLVANDYVTFKAADLAVTAGTPLTGGTNGTAHQAYLDKIESYTYNTMGVVVTDDITKKLYVAFNKHLFLDVIQHN